jgi:predicted  nucleic acid-binding Zn-ribbon protein
MIKEGILQSKMVNNAVCGNIEKLNDELLNQRNQISNIENNLAIILNEIINIQERINDNENQFKQLTKTIKTEMMSFKKVTTEMVNTRLNSNENTVREMINEVLKRLGD